jgi:hypothetical protein
LARAERELAEAAVERDRLVTEMAAVTDHTVITQISQSLADAEAHLNRVEERWLALAEELGS